MELSVLGERPRLPVTIVAPVFVIAELATTPKEAAVPKSIWAKTCPVSCLSIKRRDMCMSRMMDKLCRTKNRWVEMEQLASFMSRYKTSVRQTCLEESTATLLEARRT